MNDLKPEKKILQLWNEEKQRKQISLFYKYLKPVHTSKLIYNNTEKRYSIEYLNFTPTQDEFVEQTLKNNKDGDCFACRNRFHTRRITENVTFMKNIVIDIDQDIDQAKAKRFEDICTKYDLYIEAKAKSRGEGGYHYYIPIKPTEITNENREAIQQKIENFRYFLVEENNLDIDKKTFDLPRLIRIFGTINHKRKSYCELIRIKSANNNQIEKNTYFINSLKNNSEEYETSTTTSIVTSCPLIEYVRKNNIEKKNPDAYVNDKLLKNVAIYLKSLYGEAGKPIAMEICKKQTHNPAEMIGWWKKAGKNLVQFSCGELNNFLKESYENLLSLTCRKCKMLNQNKVEYTGGNETFYNLKKQAREKSKLLINKEVSIKGIIAPSTSAYKQEVEVFKVFEKENEDNIVNPDKLIVFFDEKVPKGTKWREVWDFTVDFFVYDLVEKGVSYLLMSEKKLDFGEYYIEGSVVKLTDQLLIGNYGKMKSRRKVILLHSARSLINKIKDHDELFKRLVGITKEDWEDYIFSYYDEDEKETYIYQQPENITQLISAYLFSAKHEFPLHFCMYGKQDSGKSTILRSIFSKFNEPYDLVDGSSSTMKGLVPSFAGNAPKLGALLESKRICCIDEFFRIIKKEEDNDKIAMMNNLLLHTRYANRSGKGDLNAKMSSKLFIVTNPIYGCNFQETIVKMPPSTIDRMLIWRQYKAHYEWVRRSRHKKIQDTKIDKYTFLSIYDYLNSFKSIYDKEKIMDIVDSLKSKVPGFMTDLYDSRVGKHHSICLMDGIIKTRCLNENDKSFKANEKDFEIFKSLWEDLIISWWETTKDVEKLISEEQKAMLNIIKDHKEIWDYQLEKECFSGNIKYEHNYKRLLSLGLIQVNNRKVKLIVEKEIRIDEILKEGDDDICFE